MRKSREFQTSVVAIEKEWTAVLAGGWFSRREEVVERDVHGS